MNDDRRQSLEEFFAQAEDVLTDWEGSPDAMNTEARRPAATVVASTPPEFPILDLRMWQTRPTPTVEEMMARCERLIAEMRVLAAAVLQPQPRSLIFITGI